MTSTALSRRALPDGALSRRTVLSTLGLAAGGTAALAAGMLPAPQAAAAPTSSAPGHRGPVAFVVGDSTASVYEQEIRPRAGWGQALPLLMGRGVTTFDYAWSGASSKSFFEAGKLDVVLDLMQPGDLLLISFGHNDSKIEDPDRGTDPDTTFKEYLTRYVEGARQQGGAPVLVTPVERRRFHADGTAGDSHGDYPRAMKELAEELEVPLVDLTASSRALWEGLGPEGTKGHFMHLEPGVHPQHPEGAEDNTHFQAVGALAVARLVAQGLVDQQIVSGSWFTRLEREIDAEAEIHWPAERTIDDALILTVGPGKAHSTVQDAVDAAPRGAGRRTIIAIDPGEHRAVVHVPSDVPRLTFLGMGERPEDTVLVYDKANGTPHPDGGTYGTTGSSTVRVHAPFFEAENLTFANDFDPAAHPEISGTQAVALLISGDFSVLRNVRCLGRQDTLYVNSPGTGVPARHYVTESHVTGDVDFIFGRGTAVFDACRIESLDRGEANNGYVTASSLDGSLRHGILFDDCAFTSTAPRRTVHLGRPWHPGGDPEANPQVLVRRCHLGAHIMSSPWTDMSGFSWRDARFVEFENRGPGSQVTEDRPQLPVESAPEHTVAAYLAADDGWAPQLAGTPADASALLDARERVARGG
ncbi:pectinesterase family protein [Nesterenkonia sp. CL21]|uniref:pectinesterase family protein n=1 Tax=Nesterenkonia sp. CL21 TaxID=3064894 RepID=UPI00287A2264|nr:pectinesterase family protein [Nesterenkonia sp. CL21]MDS2171133.1 pectinesterase family protein [Nesterenkonia sp. CL21]